MRNREKNSPNWISLREVFENSDISARALARKANVSEKTVRNKIKDGCWARKSAVAARDAASAEFVGACGFALSDEMKGRAAVLVSAMAGMPDDASSDFAFAMAMVVLGADRKAAEATLAKFPRRPGGQIHRQSVPTADRVGPESFTLAD